MRLIPVHEREELATSCRLPPLGGILAALAELPILRVTLLAGALTTVAASWDLRPPGALAVTDEMLLFALTMAVAISYRVPVRVGHQTTLYFSSVPLYLLCCHFPVPVAAAATGLGMLTRELSVCRRCGNPPDVVMTQVGRWVLLSAGISALVHSWPGDYLLYTGTLAAALLWAGDVCTAPLILPARQKGLTATIGMLASRSYAPELMQYLTGLYLLMLIQSGVDLSALMYVPLVSLTLVLLYMYLKSLDSMSTAVAEGDDGEEGQ